MRKRRISYVAPNNRILGARDGPIKFRPYYWHFALGPQISGETVLSYSNVEMKNGWGVFLTVSHRFPSLCVSPSAALTDIKACPLRSADGKRHRYRPKLYKRCDSDRRLLACDSDRPVSDFIFDRSNLEAAAGVGRDLPSRPWRATDSVRSCRRLCRRREAGDRVREWSVVSPSSGHGHPGPAFPLVVNCSLRVLLPEDERIEQLRLLTTSVCLRILWLFLNDWWAVFFEVWVPLITTENHLIMAMCRFQQLYLIRGSSQLIQSTW